MAEIERRIRKLEENTKDLGFPPVVIVRPGETSAHVADRICRERGCPPPRSAGGAVSLHIPEREGIRPGATAHLKGE